MASPTDLRASLALAERAARLAGALLRERGPVALVAESQRDVKLDADHRAEAAIVRALQAGSDFAVLAEEQGAIAGRIAGSWRWIVDPLDGSLNYLRGMPFCAVAVALCEGDEPVAGVVYDFHRDEMFTGLVGEGAWLNGAPVCVSAIEEQERAVLGTGFPAGSDFAPESLGGFVSQVREYRKVRLLGSAALSLAYVATGRLDAYLERDIKLWDVAAGLALVRAAGGRILRAASRGPHALTVYADNGLLPEPTL